MTRYPVQGGGPSGIARGHRVFCGQPAFTEAQTQYERFLREYRESPLAGQAAFGVAVCLDAQGRTAEAAERYQNLIERRPYDSMIPQVRLKLARIYEAQDQPAKAQKLYEEVTRSSAFGAAGAEAHSRLQRLLAQHPELAVPPAGATNSPVINLSQP